MLGIRVLNLLPVILSLLLNAGETLRSGALSIVSNYCTDGKYIYPFPADIVSDRTHATIRSLSLVQSYFLLYVYSS